MLPWQDRNGRFSTAKAVTLVVLFLPALWLLSQLLLDRLGADPVEILLHETGRWSLYILLASLTVSPLRRIAGWGFVLPTRRLIGVGAFSYLMAHFGLYWLDFAAGPAALLGEIFSRLYLVVGFSALLILSALATTSFDGAIKRLGGKAWRRLHLLTYPASVLALWHFTLHAKLDITEPMILWGFFAWLMGFRLLDRNQSGRPNRGRLAVLAVGVTLAVLVTEVIWYQTATGVPAHLILEANLSLMAGLRPMWWALIAGSCMLLLTLVRKERRSRPVSS